MYCIYDLLLQCNVKCYMCAYAPQETDDSDIANGQRDRLRSSYSSLYYSLTHHPGGTEGLSSRAPPPYQERLGGEGGVTCGVHLCQHSLVDVTGDPPHPQLPPYLSLPLSFSLSSSPHLSLPLSPSLSGCLSQNPSNSEPEPGVHSAGCQ